MPNWQWLTFPVVVAFALGVVATVLASGSSAAVLVLFVGALFAVGLGLARVITRTVLTRRDGG